jgi:glutaredoxin 3
MTMTAPFDPAAADGSAYGLSKAAKSPKIEIYRRDFCGFCAAAERLLQSKNLPVTTIDIWKETERKAEMVQRAGGRTSVPQIFINGQHIGGCDDLFDAERSGRLDGLLTA